MRSLLDRFYALTLWLAAACLVTIALLVGVQVIGRIADLLLKLTGRPPYGFMIASLAEMAGYLLAATTFLALAATLKRGAHIRVTMLLGVLPPRARFLFELWVLTAGSAFVAFMTWSVARLVWDSIRFNEVSYGLLPIPLAIPQAAMAVGLLALLVALLDELAITWRAGRPSFRSEEESVTGIAKEI
ncbi:MAG TPA: TRAP transporter small permease subunit [Xanthobacteraceae bacterium]|jgi:TRAP-type C4-dicarboxylate transport system permease small subunit